jgi:uncharacterized membrane protein
MAQQTLPIPVQRIDEAPEYRKWLPLLVFAACVVGFVAAPWPLAEKSHAVLHGLCAQIPSHTLHMGGNALPFDARMTGIYSGVAATMLAIGWRTRFRFAGLPSWPIVGVLAFAVLVMAIDGFNSFFLDLRRWHPYEPQNWLRVVTGAGTGIALGVTLAYLIGASLWRDFDNKTAVSGWRDLVVAAALWVLFGGALLAGWGVLYPLVAMLLVITAVGTICLISYLMLVLTRATNNRHTSFADVRIEGAIGIVLGLIVVGVLAGGRFALEHWLGIPVTIS